MTMGLPTILTIFLAGFLINRHRSVLVAVVAAVILGVLIAGGWFGSVVHTLAGMFNSLT